MHLLGIDYRLASVIAFVVSVVNNFWWNRHWTFDAKHDHPMVQGARFFAVSLLAFGFTYVVLVALVSGAGMAKVLAQAIAIAAATPLSSSGRSFGASGRKALQNARRARSWLLRRGRGSGVRHRCSRRAATTGDGARPPRRAPPPTPTRRCWSPPRTGRRQGYRLTAARSSGSPPATRRSIAELRRHPRRDAYEYTKGAGPLAGQLVHARRKHEELAQVYVDDATGKVTEAWTGFQVAWTMARGYPGAFGRRVNALYVWLPLCVLFMAPFLPWRRFRRKSRTWARPTWSLLHLDLLVLLGFSISLAFFNHGKIGLSVPLVYPFLLYLLVRMLLLAFGRGRPRRPLRLLSRSRGWRSR